jgi:hypothetical protein
MIAAQTLDEPTPEQIANGQFAREFVTHVDTNTKAMAFISLHDPVERWRRANRLSDSQLLAIAFLRRLWALAGLSQRVTANYGERIPGQGNVERRAVNEIEARADLHRVQGYVPKGYFDVFENVVRHGEPAGVAGSRLGFGDRASDIRAHTIVCFVADIVAMNERL